MTVRISLRLKLALLSLLLLLFPLLGMRLNAALKESLIVSQQDTLSLMAQAVSAALNNRSDLFDRELFHALNQDRDLYLFQLSNSIRLDGNLDDWQPELAQAETFGSEHLIRHDAAYAPESFSFRHLAGKQDKYLYAFFEVKDEHVVYRSKNSLRLDRSDHLQLVIENDAGQRKYIVTAYEDGWVNGFLLPDTPIKFPVSEQRIQGAWKRTVQGYILELRISLDLLGSKLAFAIADVDNEQTRSIRALIGTANLEKDNEPGWLLSTSTSIEEILRSLDRPHARIRVVDQNQRIRAQVGSLRKPEEPPAEPGELTARIMRWTGDLLQPLYRFFITNLPADFKDQVSQPTELDLQGIREGLEGKHSVTSYLMEDEQVEVMAAIAPVYEQDKVIAAVVVEQTTNSILALSNRMIEETVTLSVLAFLFGGGVLLLFAFRISGRIRRLRDQAGDAIAPDGHIRSTVQKERSDDEIGDLGRTLDAMLSQLQLQIEHREQMADNLEHEMRTPLAGVAASLKNLKQEQMRQEKTPRQIMEYIKWAERDVQRLEGLLTSIREATTLKNALLQESREAVDIGKALSIWLEHGWQLSFSGVEFLYQPPEQEVLVDGDPVRLHQALDKLVENAVSFHSPDTPLELKLTLQTDQVAVQVLNQGPPIELALQQQIFNSMVSHRPLKDDRPHMGLGLYIVRTIIEHHGGRVTVRNLEDGRTGVAFAVTLPLAAAQ